MAKKMNSSGGYDNIKEVVDSKGAKIEKKGTIKNNPSDSKKEMTAVSKNATDKSAENIQGRGTAVGNPNLRKGKKAKLAGLGKKFEGDYHIVETTHTVSSSGYGVSFSVSANSKEITKDKSTTKSTAESSKNKTPAKPVSANSKIKSTKAPSTPATTKKPTPAQVSGREPKKPTPTNTSKGKLTLGSDGKYKRK